MNRIRVFTALGTFLMTLPAYGAISFINLGGLLPGGGGSSGAWGVSADGTTVVGSAGTFEGGRAFRWTESGGMVSLGLLPGSEFELSK